VKFKVFVTERDVISGHDDIDGFVRLLRLTPALNDTIANWTQLTIYGMRSSHRTRLLLSINSRRQQPHCCATLLQSWKLKCWYFTWVW